MDQYNLYPLTFEPLYQYRLWGGRRLSSFLSKPLPDNELIGEAWLLSDREDQTSHIAEGPLKGKTIKEIMEEAPDALMGKAATHYKHFPLLLKFLDATTVLSVQVHPSDDMKEYIPEGGSGKTEAWVVLQSGAEGRIFAGLKPGTTADSLRDALNSHRVADLLPSFKAEVDDAIFIPAGTVHTLTDVVVFEIQENSDVTFRLYDWDRIDEKTGKPRELQIIQAIACINYSQGFICPQVLKIESETHISREKLFDCDYFILWRIKGKEPFPVGEENLPRILVCIEGSGSLEYQGTEYILNKGDVMLLPAALGISQFKPQKDVQVFEIALPRKDTF